MRFTITEPIFTNTSPFDIERSDPIIGKVNIIQKNYKVGVVMSRLTKDLGNGVYTVGDTLIDGYTLYGYPINKLGQLENIEEELGIDLITLFKVIKQQKVWTKYNNEIDLCDNCEYQLLESFIYFYWDSGKHLVYELKDYGKTWALTKEELK